LGGAVDGIEKRDCAEKQRNCAEELFWLWAQLRVLAAQPRMPS